MYQLFLITPTDEFQVSLRRYRNEAPDGDDRQTKVIIGTEVVDSPYHGFGDSTSVPADDPRWPHASEDGYVFTDADGRMVAKNRLWSTPSGELVTLHTAPPGACYEAPREREGNEHFYWNVSRQYDQEHAAHRGVYMVKLPPGPHDWFSPDWGWGRGEGANPHRDGWQVSGTLPIITVSPSVNRIGVYHGWIGTAGLAPGEMSRDLEGKPY